MQSINNHIFREITFNSLPNQTCVNIFQQVNRDNAKFVEYAMMASDPFKACTDSLTFTAYRSTMKFYNQLLTFHDPQNTSFICSDEFLNKNRMNVVTSFITTSRNLWESANCDACYNDSASNVQVFSNETRTFNSSFHAHLECTKNASSKDSVCSDCDSSYQTLNSIYEILKKATNNKVCFDLDDQVNDS